MSGLCELEEMLRTQRFSSEFCPCEFEILNLPKYVNLCMAREWDGLYPALHDITLLAAREENQAVVMSSSTHKFFAFGLGCLKARAKQNFGTRSLA